MKIKITIICENLLEERASDLIASAASCEIQQPSQNEFTISSGDIARAADLLHAIRSVIWTAQKNMDR